VGLFWIAMLLGIVEGLTEFLPVSSTGHLIVAGQALGLSGEKAKAFEIFIQLGAVLAVIWYYRRELAETAGGILTRRANRQFAEAVLIAFIPAALVGLALHHWIEQHLFSPRAVAPALVLGGVAILAVELLVRRAGPGGRNTGEGGSGRLSEQPGSGRVLGGTAAPAATLAQHAPAGAGLEAPPRGASAAFLYEDARAIPFGVAAWIGLAQVLSLYPGVSRSAATILGGLLLGLSRRAATEFSFYLAIPTLGSACLYSLLKVARTLSAGDAAWFAIGLIVSFVSSVIVIRFLLAWVKSHDFRPFAWYRIAFGLAVLFVFRK